MEIVEHRDPTEAKRKMDYPPIIYNDVNDYSYPYVLYLIHIVDNYYKFGAAMDIKAEYKAQYNIFSKYDIKLIDIWRCNSAAIMHEIEEIINTFAKQNEMLTQLDGVINMDNRYVIIELLNTYTKEKNLMEVRSIAMNASLSELAKMKVSTNKNLRLQIEIAKINEKIEGEQLKEADVKIAKLMKKLNEADDKISKLERKAQYLRTIQNK